jgi:hypothetical protein
MSAQIFSFIIPYLEQTTSAQIFSFIPYLEQTTSAQIFSFIPYLEQTTSAQIFSKKLEEKLFTLKLC